MLSSSATASSSFSSHSKLRRNQVHGDHQHRTSSPSHVVFGGLTDLPCRMSMMNTNKHVKYLLSSSKSSGSHHYSFSRSLQPNKRTSHIRELNAIENLPAGTPLPTPPGPPNSGWFNWILWTVIPMLFPFFKNNMSPLMLLKQKVDTVVGIVDHAAEVLEDVAEEVVKITDEFEDIVPDGSALKKAMCSVHEVAEEAIKVADLAEELVDKGEALEKKMEDLLEKQEAAAAAEGQQQQKAENIEKKMVDLAQKHESVITAAKEVETDMKDFVKTTEAMAAAKRELKNAKSKKEGPA
ncbi:hypothetical protein MKX01_005293 [Papaver californicum]|nr:hypothetical protein MKX01_005293 [Papaver californicum]